MTTYTASRMVRDLTKPRPMPAKLQYVFEHADRVQKPGYSRDEVLEVFRAVIRVIHEMLIIVDRPDGKKAISVLNKMMQAGWKIACGAFFDTVSRGEAPIGLDGLMISNPSPRPISSQAAPKKTAPKKTAPKKTAPKKTAPKKTAPQKTAPKRTAPKKTAPKKTAPKKTAPKKTLEILVIGGPAGRGR